MAATTIASIIRQVRQQLLETKPGKRFWQDDELTDILKLGVMDLWGAMLDLHQDHYFKVVEDGSCYQGASKSALDGCAG
jgi:hypothetical protein